MSKNDPNTANRNIRNDLDYDKKYFYWLYLGTYFTKGR